MTDSKRESEPPKETQKGSDDTFTFMGARISLGSKAARSSASQAKPTEPQSPSVSPAVEASEKSIASAESAQGGAETLRSLQSSGELVALAAASNHPRSSWIFALGAGVLLLVVAVIVGWYWFGSTEAKILRLAKSKQLVSPQGSSAYDLYLQIKANGISPVAREKLKDKVLPELLSQGDALLKKLYEGSNLKESETHELVRIYEWAADLDPQDKSIAARRMYAAGCQAVLKGDDSEALSSFSAAIRSDSQWALPFNDLARLYAKAGNQPYVEYYHQQATQLQPKWVLPRLDLAGLSLERNRLGEAELGYRLAAELDPTLATPWYFLGRIYQRQKRDVEAIAAYERALELARGRPSLAFTVDEVRGLLVQMQRN
jgi:tetratricopeptide (TPR) repeat protein